MARQPFDDEEELNEVWQDTEDDDDDELVIPNCKEDSEPSEDEDEDENNAVDSYRRETRPSRMDITKNSKEDHRFPQRVTQKDMHDHVKQSYKYMIKMVVMPFTIIHNYPFKKRGSDSDIIDAKKSNVSEEVLLVFGKLMKWRGVMKDEYVGLPYMVGEALLVRPGRYDIGEVRRQYIALKVKRTYKVNRIKKRFVRALFASIKNEVRAPWPFEFVEKFPVRLD